MNGEKRHSAIASADDDSTHNLIAPHQKGEPMLIGVEKAVDLWISIAEPSSTHAKIFEPNKQTWALFKGQSFRLVFTVVLVVLYIGTLKIYQVEGNVSHKNKEVFNTVTTVLSLALGLNFLVCLAVIIRIVQVTPSYRLTNIRKHSKTWPKSYAGESWLTENSQSAKPT